MLHCKYIRPLIALGYAVDFDGERKLLTMKEIGWHWSISCWNTSSPEKFTVLPLLKCQTLTPISFDDFSHLTIFNCIWNFEQTKNIQQHGSGFGCLFFFGWPLWQLFAKMPTNLYWFILIVYMYIADLVVVWNTDNMNTPGQTKSII